jgi:hypothetical protein
MKKTFLALVFLFTTLGIFAQNSNVRYDGVYRSERGDSYHYIKFYPDDTVISVTSTGEPNEMTEWFSKPYDDSGIYKIKKKKISFNSTSSYGTVLYRGKIVSEDKMILKIESLINGYKTEETFCFFKQ